VRQQNLSSTRKPLSWNLVGCFYHTVTLVTLYHLSHSVICHTVTLVTMYHLSYSVICHTVTLVTMYHLSHCITCHTVSLVILCHISRCDTCHTVSLILCHISRCDTCHTVSLVIQCDKSYIVIFCYAMIWYNTFVLIVLWKHLTCNLYVTRV